MQLPDVGPHMRSAAAGGVLLLRGMGQFAGLGVAAAQLAEIQAAAAAAAAREREQLFGLDRQVDEAAGSSDSSSSSWQALPGLDDGSCHGWLAYQARQLSEQQLASLAQVLVHIGVGKAAETHAAGGYSSMRHHNQAGRSSTASSSATDGAGRTARGRLLALQQKLQLHMAQQQHDEAPGAVCDSDSEEQECAAAGGQSAPHLLGALWNVLAAVRPSGCRALCFLQLPWECQTYEAFEAVLLRWQEPQKREQLLRQQDDRRWQLPMLHGSQVCRRCHTQQGYVRQPNKHIACTAKADAAAVSCRHAADTAAIPAAAVALDAAAAAAARVLDSDQPREAATTQEETDEDSLGATADEWFTFATASTSAAAPAAVMDSPGLEIVTQHPGDAADDVQRDQDDPSAINAHTLPLGKPAVTGLAGSSDQGSCYMDTSSCSASSGLGADADSEEGSSDSNDGQNSYGNIEGLCYGFGRRAVCSSVSCIEAEVDELVQAGPQQLALTEQQWHLALGEPLSELALLGCDTRARCVREQAAKVTRWQQQTGAKAHRAGMRGV